MGEATLLGLLHLGCGYKLHGFGNLPCVFYGLDAALDIANPLHRLRRFQSLRASLRAPASSGMMALYW